MENYYQQMSFQRTYENDPEQYYDENDWNHEEDYREEKMKKEKKDKKDKKEKKAKSRRSDDWLIHKSLSSKLNLLFFYFIDFTLFILVLLKVDFLMI